MRELPKKNRVQVLQAKIAAIQKACLHLSADIDLSYHDHKYETGDACGNAWTEIETHTTFHCGACEKKWIEKEKVTRAKYTRRNAPIVAKKEQQQLEKKTARAKGASRKAVRL